MKLFRGYPERPIIMSSAKRRELAVLRAKRYVAMLRAKDPGDPVQILDNMGDATFKRWYALEIASSPQSFTDDEVTARQFAGEKGFVISMDVPEPVVKAHYEGEQMMAPNDEAPRMASQFLFSGEEVQRLFETKTATLIDIQQEQREGVPAPESRLPIA